MRFLTAQEVALILEVTTEHVRRIKGLQAVRGYPADQVRAELVKRGYTQERIEALLGDEEGEDSRG